MKMSCAALVSPPARFVDDEPNTTYRPSGVIEPSTLLPLAPTSCEFTLTRRVLCRSRSRTKTSYEPFVSPGARFVAADVNTTKAPVAEIRGEKLASLPSPPSFLRLIRRVVPSLRSRTNTSSTPFVSPDTRFVAPETNAT